MLASILDFIKGIFKYHKLKVLLFLLLVPFFYALLFPIADVKNRINEMISANTRQNANSPGLEVDFTDVGLQILPPGIYVTNPEIQPWNFGAISATRLEVTPSLAALFRGMPLGSVSLQGLFAGDFSVDVARSDKSKSENPQLTATIEARAVQLGDVIKYIMQSFTAGTMSLNLDGKLNLDTRLDEISMKPSNDLPKGTIAIEIPQLTIPAQSANMGGPLTLPQIRMGKTTAKLNLDSSKVTIEEFAFGSGKEDLTGRIKGDVNLTRVGPQMMASGAKLNVELTLTNSYLESISKSGLSLAFLYLDKCRVNKGDSSSYRFDIQLPAPVPVPVCL